MWKGNSIAMKKSHPADYEYWSQMGWIDGSYYYPTHISLWKRLLLRLIGTMGSSYMKKMYKDY
jgi:hypothetical protein